MKRAALAIFVAVALTGCGSTSPSPTQPPPTNGQQTALPTTPVPTTPGSSAQPTATTAPGPTDPGPTPEPGTDEPLPEPTLTDPAEIAESLFDPDRVADGVVSLVAAMGVSVYDAGGNLLRAGSGDLTLTEAALRGFISMTRDDLLEIDLSGGPYPIADMYTGLRSSLPAGYTLDDLLADFNAAYGSAPDSLAAQILRDQELDTESGLLRIQMWVLLIDGFVAPLQTAASPRPGGLAQIAPRGAIGTARHYTPALTSPTTSMTDAEWTELLAAVPHLATAIEFKILTAPDTIHEGHGGQGSPQTFSAAVGLAPPYESYVTGRTLLQAAPRPGIRVTWRSINEATWAFHGAFDPPLGTAQLVDPGELSSAGMTYTPIEEAANGAGTTLNETAFVTARVSQADLLSHSYDLSVLGDAVFLAGGTIAALGPGHSEIGWHKLGTGYTIDIVWTDYYAGIADVITFRGVADARQSGIQGVDAYYTGSGGAFGSRPGFTSCNPILEVVPSGFGTAEFSAGIQDDKVTIAAYPSFGSPLQGIFAGPFILPQEGGETGIHMPAEPGALCPHRIEGTIKAQPFGQP